MCDLPNVTAVFPQGTELKELDFTRLKDNFTYFHISFAFYLLTFLISKLFYFAIWEVTSCSPQSVFYFL